MLRSRFCADNLSEAIVLRMPIRTVLSKLLKSKFFEFIVWISYDRPIKHWVCGRGEMVWSSAMTHWTTAVTAQWSLPNQKITFRGKLFSDDFLNLKTSISKLCNSLCFEFQTVWTPNYNLRKWIPNGHLKANLEVNLEVNLELNFRIWLGASL